MKNRDILFVCQFFYPEYVSSAQLPFETAEEFAKMGYKVGVLCGYPKEYSDIKEKIALKEVYKGISIRRVRYLELNRKTVIGRLINYFSFVVAILIKIFKFKDYKYAIVYSNPPMLPIIAVLAKKLFRTHFIFVSYDVYPEIAVKAGKLRKGSLIYKLFEITNKLVFNNVDKVIAVSKDMGEFLCSERNISEKKVAVIPNWCEDKEGILSKQIYKNELFEAIPENAFVVSYLGNMGTCQEMQTLLDCIRKLNSRKDIHFVFAGHGNKMETIRSIVQTEKLQQVHIFGFLKGQDYEDILRRSDIFIVTLLKGLKGLCSPSKTYNYLMAGKPVIGVMDNGMELALDIIENECGYIISHGKSKEMEEKIIQLKDSNILQNQMGINARNLYYHKYKKSLCLNEYKKLLQN